MTVDDRRMIFDALVRLLPRIARDQPTRMSSLRTFCSLLEAVSSDTSAEHDERLFLALENNSESLRPLARGLLSLRMGLNAGLQRQACLDLALAGVLSLGDVDRLATERVRSPGGNSLRAEVLHLLQCRNERLDGSGPMGLSGTDLDAPVSILAVACAYVDRLAEGWSGVRALASICGDQALFDEECARHLVSLLSVYPIGSYVALESGEKGRVVAARLNDPLHPIVLLRLRADGAVFEPALLCEPENPPQVVSLLSEPWVGTPAAGETAQGWLQRLHGQLASWPKAPPPPLPVGLKGDWRPTDHREQTERKQQREQVKAELQERERAERTRKQEQAEPLKRERAARNQRRRQRKSKEELSISADRVHVAAQRLLTRLDRLPQSGSQEKAPNE